MTASSTTSTIKSTYRAILRELPRRSLNNRTPLHTRIRETYKQTITSTSTNTSELSPQALAALQQAEQFAAYAKAQRTYAALVDRYNPGSLMDEEERVRLTARRVGLDLPELHTDKKDGKGEGNA
ncbi:hypothetical protein BDV19DRAFT_386741 [Aspergillus venezuelensis]